MIYPMFHQNANALKELTISNLTADLERIDTRLSQFNEIQQSELKLRMELDSLKNKEVACYLIISLSHSSIISLWLIHQVLLGDTRCCWVIPGVAKWNQVLLGVLLTQCPISQIYATVFPEKILQSSKVQEENVRLQRNIQNLREEKGILLTRFSFSFTFITELI